MVLSIILGSSWPSVRLLWINVCSDLLLIFWIELFGGQFVIIAAVSVIVVFAIEVYKFFIGFGYEPLIRYVTCKYFLSHS